MKDFRTGIVVWLVAAATAWSQAPVSSPPAPPPIPQLPTGFRPIRVPQLAPVAPVTAPAPNVQTPLAPPAESTRVPMFAPAGVNGRPGAPFAPAPGQPLQPIHQIGARPGAIQPAYQAPPLQPASYLAWDSERRETNVVAGQTSVPFNFWVTNVSSEVVTVNSVRTSCGCTVARLPTMPWKLDPGASGEIPVTMSTAGKMGSIEKAVMVDSTTGTKTLIVRANMPAVAGNQPAAAGGIDPDRLKNMQMALADRQVVFKGECAKCHAEPAVNKTGEQLYVAACGICHDSVHRAAMVPDLKNLRHPTNEEHWRKWTRSGRPGSMMPGFAKSEGGPLTDEQIESLVKFLTDTITAKAKPVNSLTPAAASAQVQPTAGSTTASATPVPKTNVQ
jgi:mono/diheme cytochrome c family protein